ncbi:MAG: hypothetical protein M1308_15675 [Actinobacteria bacterium]|nr:hypothetical protein [Actinomycetota bacterium]
MKNLKELGDMIQFVHALKKPNYGFIPPEYNPNDYKFGDGQLSAEVLAEDGQWDSFLPSYEAQSNPYFDTMHCWVFGTLNCLETLQRRKFGDTDANYSERYIGVLGGATPQGGSPRNASEAIRKYGNIPQEALPYSSDIKSFWAYSSPRPMTQKYLTLGAEWLKTYSYGYDFVKTNYGKWLWKMIKGVVTGNKLGGLQQEMIKDALKYSPLGVSVCAWKFRNGLAYKNSWDSDNHWLELYGYEDGKYWKLYDHYTNTYVKAEWLYPFGFILRYTLNKLNNTDMARTIKAKDDPNVYMVANNSKELIKVEAFNSYKFMLDRGWITPYDEVDTLAGYTVTENNISITN